MINETEKQFISGFGLGSGDEFNYKKDTEMNWRPIETAPKNGGGVLVYHQGSIFVAWFGDRIDTWLGSDAQWMPLPDPPARS